jgi:hypothetical protein
MAPQRAAALLVGVAAAAAGGLAFVQPGTSSGHHGSFHKASAVESHRGSSAFTPEQLSDDAPQSATTIQSLLLGAVMGVAVGLSGMAAPANAEDPSVKLPECDVRKGCTIPQMRAWGKAYRQKYYPDPDVVKFPKEVNMIRYGLSQEPGAWNDLKFDLASPFPAKIRNFNLDRTLNLNTVTAEEFENDYEPNAKIISAKIKDYLKAKEEGRPLPVVKQSPFETKTLYPGMK